MTQTLPLFESIPSHDTNQAEENDKKHIPQNSLYPGELEKELEVKKRKIKPEIKNLINKIKVPKDIDKELKSFSYLSSHDLQEPLRKIQTFSSRILEKEQQNLSEQGKDYFDRMQKAAHRMQTLIEDLSAYAKLDSTEKIFQRMDLNIVLDQVKNDLKQTIDKKKATIDSNQLCEANIIPFQFRQLLKNILDNALKFSDAEKQLRITIKAQILNQVKPNIKKAGPKKNYCHINITDNGIGFEPHFSERIFEVFQCLHGKEKYDGTGIGLAVCKKIVENHKGIINATGELNKGASFDIYIPAD